MDTPEAASDEHGIARDGKGIHSSPDIWIPRSVNRQVGLEVSKAIA
jgi:hypothetical protein